MQDLEITVPSVDNVMVSRLRIQLQAGAPTEIMIDAPPGARPGFCYPNVDSVVQRHGGRRIEGWAIWQYEDYFIEAERHAIWQMPHMDFLCVTPQPLVATDRILFCSCPSPLFRGVRIKTERLIISKERLVEHYFSCVDAMNTLKEQLIDRGITHEELCSDLRILAAISSVYSAVEDLRNEK